MRLLLMINLKRKFFVVKTTEKKELCNKIYTKILSRKRRIYFLFRSHEHRCEFSEYVLNCTVGWWGEQNKGQACYLVGRYGMFVKVEKVKPDVLLSSQKYVFDDCHAWCNITFGLCILRLLKADTKKKTCKTLKVGKCLMKFVFCKFY